MTSTRQRGRPRLLLLVVLAVVMVAATAQEDLPPVVEAGSGDVETRLSRIERLIDSQGLLDLANRVEALQREVQRLQGQIEEQQHVINELNARQQRRAAPPPTAALPPSAAAVTPLPPRNTATDTLPAAGQPGAPIPNTPPAPQGPGEIPQALPPSPAGPPAQVATNAPAPPVAAEADQAYDAAFNLLKTGKYDDAIAQFNNFLVTYPDSPRADSAQYWLGEAYYVNKQYDPAITEYQKLVTAYPNSQKVSQALLKIGFCQAELGQREQARATLDDVKQRFPGTTSARMAEDRLQRMRLEQNP
ncbi:MAG: tol-pal system protein YbgF [Chromatiales bacterium]